VILFKRDMNWDQRAGHDDGTAPIERQPGPLPPFGERTGNDDAARRDLDDFRPGADVGTYPRVER
jgi:hypothetical protein